MLPLFLYQPHKTSPAWKKKDSVFDQASAAQRSSRTEMSIGVPVKLLHEAEGHTVTMELKNGEIYRGHLIEAEDNMNCQVLSSVCCSATRASYSFFTDLAPLRFCSAEFLRHL